MKSTCFIEQAAATKRVTQNSLSAYFDRYQRLYEKNRDANALEAIKKARNKTFDGLFAKQGIELQTKLLDGLTTYPVSNNMVIGSDIAEKVLERTYRSALLITERTPFHFLCQHTQIHSSAFQQVYYYDDIRKGDDLEVVLKSVNRQTKYLIGIGGGRPMDILKFLGWRTNLAMLAFPTSLTSHVYASPKIHALPAIKDLGYPRTIDGSAPHLAITDLSLLEALEKNSSRLIKAGLGDIMAFHTARYDWNLSNLKHERPRNIFVDDLISDILHELETIPCDRPLREWIRRYELIQALLCHITDWIGSAPASGSEHLFALAVDDLGPTCLHGELVALGVLLASRLQHNDTIRAQKIIHHIGLPTSLRQIKLTKEDVINALLACRELGEFKNRHTIFTERCYSKDDFASVLHELLREGVIKK